MPLFRGGKKGNSRFRPPKKLNRNRRIFGRGAEIGLQIGPAAILGENGKTFWMKIKLNLKQINNISRELQETDRKKYDLDEVSDVFKMLQYWAKTVGGGDPKIKSIVELGDGYLCRVNPTFQDTMKMYLKDIQVRRTAEFSKEKRQQDTMEEYERLIKEAEKQEGGSRGHG